MSDLRLTIEELAKGIAVQTGRQMIVEVTFPKVQHFALPHGIFPAGSAFPTPGILPSIRLLHNKAGKRPGDRLVVFGHADRKSSSTRNKTLSDLRAKAILALLTRDLQMFDALAKEGDWTVWHYQAMLRGLKCNPGRIDNKLNETTRSATRAFQEAYNLGEFHSAPESPSRRCAKIAEDGQLTAETEAAIRDAYLAAFPKGLEASRFAGPKHSGCSGFNDSHSTDARTRRASVAFITDSSLYRSTFPCKEGNSHACPVDGRLPARCRFYRTHFFHELHAEPTEPFFDLHWMHEETGTVFLSALTRLSEARHVTFTIYRYLDKLPEKMPSSLDNDPPPPPVEAIAEIDGQIRGGVAFAYWNPAGEFDPFNHSQWLVDLSLPIYGSDAGEPLPDLSDSVNVHPPVFKIESQGEWRFSRSPGVQLGRIRVSKDSTAEGLAFRDDGSIVAWKASGGVLKPVQDDGKPAYVLDLAMPEHALRTLDDEDGAKGSGGARP